MVDNVAFTLKQGQGPLMEWNADGSQCQGQAWMVRERYHLLKGYFDLYFEPFKEAGRALLVTVFKQSCPK